ncbi:flagella biosynthesis chaperone FlgN [Cronobacter dublinensis]|uniref:flagella biosynthesis chaperone FlgN n=1 Tax=Cronobacter dublinensis TaxID=413497 RepID=UPI00029BE589|nr:flagella biosynthesis chaperone FlgN [Cronobacter dublinensis]CCJ83879.1 Flagellar biosynthesis protein FlgN [Cronobacter dublinensis 582]EGT4358936.1 flagella biosynthesis chaperone FlgN [Cronobacter dublinensis]EKF2278886.1 flagella biosynthesis chaperone FlgN [Cronobacter dublinensis]EKF2292977.1 flagella biosynthesis chaperone FlgN [Cronobacter dublinensis]EKF2296316.1 flagella biosynthesis chaperone FlgN [Cronobacter dublinensis]
MSRLSEVLDQMTTVLNSLKSVMDAEQHQLSAGSLNGSALQRITEEKSSLLATLDYLEQQRRSEQNSQRGAQPEMAERWQTITQKTLHLRDMNLHNGWLLEGQMARNQQALAVLKPHQEPALYGANGQTSASMHRGGKKIAI